MFSLIPSATFTDQVHDSHRAFDRESRIPSRMDVQRHKLEHQKMHNIDVMTLAQRSQDVEQKLRRQLMVAEAREQHVSIASKVRLTVGSALISIGEKIRPELARNSEPTFNA